MGERQRGSSQFWLVLSNNQSLSQSNQIKKKIDDEFQLISKCQDIDMERERDGLWERIRPDHTMPIITITRMPDWLGWLSAFEANNTLMDCKNPYLEEKTVSVIAHDWDLSSSLWSLSLLPLDEWIATERASNECEQTHTSGIPGLSVSLDRDSKAYHTINCTSQMDFRSNNWFDLSYHVCERFGLLWQVTEDRLKTASPPLIMCV